jgi:hypothetical protein
MNFNDTTFIISIFFLPIWAVWELIVLLVLRPKGAAVDGQLVGTISMIMQQRAYQLNVIPFFWTGMTAHWWFNWLRTKVWDVPAPAITFWVILGLTLTADILLWNVAYQQLPALAKVYRAPMVQCALAFILAYSLFPQQALTGSGWRWW